MILLQSEADVWLFLTAHCLMVTCICPNFHEDIQTGVRDMKRAGNILFKK